MLFRREEQQVDPAPWLALDQSHLPLPTGDLASREAELSARLGLDGQGEISITSVHSGILSRSDVIYEGRSPSGTSLFSLEMVPGARSAWLRENADAGLSRGFYRMLDTGGKPVALVMTSGRHNHATVDRVSHGFVGLVDGTPLLRFSLEWREGVDNQVALQQMAHFFGDHASTSPEGRGIHWSAVQPNGTYRLGLEGNPPLASVQVSRDSPYPWLVRSLGTGSLLYPILHCLMIREVSILLFSQFIYVK